MNLVDRAALVDLLVRWIEQPEDQWERVTRMSEIVGALPTRGASELLLRRVRGEAPDEVVAACAVSDFERLTSRHPRAWEQRFLLVPALFQALQERGSYTEAIRMATPAERQAWEELASGLQGASGGWAEDAG